MRFTIRQILFFLLVTGLLLLACRTFWYARPSITVRNETGEALQDTVVFAGNRQWEFGTIPAGENQTLLVTLNQPSDASIAFRRGDAMRSKHHIDVYLHPKSRGQVIIRVQDETIILENSLYLGYY
jgi:hypothetical protein